MSEWSNLKRAQRRACVVMFRVHWIQRCIFQVAFCLNAMCAIRCQAVLSGFPSKQFPVFSLQPFSCCTDVTISDCISWFLYYLSVSLNSMSAFLLRSILLIGFIYWPLTAEYDNSAFFDVPVPTTHVRTSELSSSLNTRS